MISLRLPENLEEKLNELTRIEHKTKTDIIRESLDMYIELKIKAFSPYDLGKQYFGKYDSGIPGKSREHSKLIREKIKKKYRG